MTTAPSPLALELAARLFPKTAAQRAPDIERYLEGYRWRERERIRDENKLKPGYRENILVKRGRNGAEFFELQLLPPEPDNPYEVMFKRYAVPGRYWIYAFYWTDEGSGRVVWGSEGSRQIAADLKMVEEDLGKPQVVDLFKQAFAAERVVYRYQRDTLRLLEALAPRSKAYRATKRLCETTMEARRVRIEAERKQRSTLCELDTCQGGKALP